MAAKIQDGRRRPQDMNFGIHFSISHIELKFFHTLFVSVEYLEFLNNILNLIVSVLDQYL